MKRRGGARWGRFTGLSLALAALAGCGGGPTDEEIVYAVAVAGPIVLGLVLLLSLPLRSLWRRADDRVAFRARPSLIALVVMGAVAGVLVKGALAVGAPVPLAIVVFGTSVLTLWLVVWRLWLALRPASAFTWAHLWVVGLMTLPAFAAAASSDFSLVEYVLYAWMFPGYAGLVALPLYVIVLIEALVRNRRAQRKAD